MNTLAEWWNARFIGAFVRWIEADPLNVAELAETVALQVMQSFSGWTWVGNAITNGATRWIENQTPERVEFLIETGIEGWVATQEAAAALAAGDPVA